MKYKCEKCNYSTALKKSLKKQIQYVHNNLKYICEQCDYKAAQKCNINTQIESVHECNPASSLQDTQDEYWFLHKKIPAGKYKDNYYKLEITLGSVSNVEFFQKDS